MADERQWTVDSGLCAAERFLEASGFHPDSEALKAIRHARKANTRPTPTVSEEQAMAILVRHFKEANANYQGDDRSKGFFARRDRAALSAVREALSDAAALSVSQDNRMREATEALDRAKIEWVNVSRAVSGMGAGVLMNNLLLAIDDARAALGQEAQVPPSLEP